MTNNIFSNFLFVFFLLKICNLTLNFSPTSPINNNNTHFVCWGSLLCTAIVIEINVCFSLYPCFSHTCSSSKQIFQKLQTTHKFPLVHANLFAKNRAGNTFNQKGVRCGVSLFARTNDRTAQVYEIYTEHKLCFGYSKEQKPKSVSIPNWLLENMKWLQISYLWTCTKSFRSIKTNNFSTCVDKMTHFHLVFVLFSSACTMYRPHACVVRCAKKWALNLGGDLYVCVYEL